MNLCVIDTNFWKNPGLLSYLSSTDNHILISDFVAMELYKDNSINYIAKNLHKLKKYANQIHMLKNTSSVVYIIDDDASLRNILIQKYNNYGFLDYIEHLSMAANGNLILQQQIEDHISAAKEHLDFIKSNSLKTKHCLLHIIDQIKKKSVWAHERRQMFSETIAPLIYEYSCMLAAKLFDDFGIQKQNIANLFDTFIFRASLLQCLVALDWCIMGGLKDAKEKKMCNDSVDAYIVAYSTYYDGILSCDKKLNDLYKATRLYLDYFKS